MTDLRTAAQQALEALERYQVKRQDFDRFADEITALRAALAQEQAEPVAWLYEAGTDRTLHWHKPPLCGTPLYTAPPRCPNCASLEAQNNELDRKLAELEQVDLSRCPQCGGIADNGHDRSIPPNSYFCTKCTAELSKPLYTTPPQRQPLTDDEIFAIENDIPDDVVSDRHWTIWYARAVERAHGIIEPRIEEDSHQTLDDAMQQPRAMAQAYENGYRAGIVHERERIIQFLQEMQRVVGDAHNHYGVAAVRIKERV